MKSTIERFENKIIKCESGCWVWSGANSGRYGKFYFPNYPIKYSKSMVSSHRASIYLYKGLVPKDGEDVMHSCDNGLCVNPSHLSIGTHRENMLDMVNKGRCQNHSMKVSEDFAYLIKMYREAGFTVRFIHNYLCPSISEPQISRISRGMRR